MTNCKRLPISIKKRSFGNIKKSAYYIGLVHHLQVSQRNIYSSKHPLFNKTTIHEVVV